MTDARAYDIAAVQNLRDLQARVRAAEGPDREIDVALEVTLDTKQIGWEKWSIAQLYTSSLDAAVALVERMLPGWFWRMWGGRGKPGAHLNRVNLELCERHDEAHGDGVTPCLALIDATLSALIAKAEREGAIKSEVGG